jgi:hypothetical protein
MSDVHIDLNDEAFTEFEVFLGFVTDSVETIAAVGMTAGGSSDRSIVTG